MGQQPVRPEGQTQDGLVGPADLILHNGRVITLDDAGRIIEAVAIRGEQILAIGTSRDMLALAGPSTRRIDVGGRAVIPGLIDGHAHLDREGLKDLLPSLAGARCIADLLAMIADLAAAARPGEWIVTNPVGDPPDYSGVPGNLREGRLPNRAELDRAAPDNPVYIRAPWGYWANEQPLHSAANTRALALAGITRETPSPSSMVTIERDARGEPTGIFREMTTMPIVEFTLMAAAPGFTFAQRCEALARSGAIYAGFGTTSAFEGHGVAPEIMAAYQHLRNTGRLAMRANLVFSPGWSGVPVPDIAAMIRSWGAWLGRRGLGDAWLHVAGLYAEIDEAPEGRLRARLAPNTGWAGFCGDCGLPHAAVRELLREAARNGIRVAGIWANLLDLFAEVDRETPIAGERWVLGHQSLLAPTDIARIRDLGVALTTHTNRHIHKDGAKLRARIGAEREDEIVPLRRLLDAGVAVAFGSDNHPPSLFHPIWHAVERIERAGGTVVAAAQRLSRVEALRCATMGGAWLTFEEGKKGSIEAGKLADIAVLSDDPLTVAPERLPGITSWMTIVGGRIVHATRIIAGAEQSL